MDGRLLGGRYRLLEAHAMGGMASVWRAHDERTGEVVAIKRLHPHLIEDEGARERFRREAAAMEAIRHPNVVAVRDAILDDDEPALVMDFVAGRSVAELAADGHRFDKRRPWASARRSPTAGDGPRPGIVHRDLKPANVLIGDDGVVRLSDFGIAVDSWMRPPSRHDGVVGTLRYLAPERLAGAGDARHRRVGSGDRPVRDADRGGGVPGHDAAARVEASTPVPRPVADATWAVLAGLACDRDRYPDGAPGLPTHRCPGSDPPDSLPAAAGFSSGAAMAPSADPDPPRH